MRVTRQPYHQEFKSLGINAKETSWIVRRRRGIEEVFYGGGQDHPQYAALHRSSYLRLVSHSGSAWGTSIVLMPSFWAGGRYWQGASIQVEWKSEGADLVGFFTGKITGLQARGQVRLLPPEPNLTTAVVSVELEGNAAFDERSGEGFKPIVLSSMNISTQEWDCDLAVIESQSFKIPKSEWIMHPALRGRIFGLRGGTSQKWKTNAPTVEVILDREMSISGWVTPSQNHNDDNVALWAASDSPIRFWEYRVLVKQEPLTKCISPLPR